MKKILVSLFLFISLFTFAASSINAAVLSAGASTWYTTWDLPSEAGVEIDPFLLYGPLLSVKLSQDFSLSTVFLYSNFDAVSPEDPAYSQPEITFDMTRIDSDTALNYRLTDKLKLITGLKVMWYKMAATYPADPPAMPEPQEIESTHYGLGPALGLSLTIPLYGNFFLMGNLSAMYLWTTSTHQELDDEHSHEYGFNAGVSVAYYIAKASVTVMLGGRYQSFTSDEADDDEPWSTFYGVTLGAVYSFKI